MIFLKYIVLEKFSMHFYACNVCISLTNEIVWVHLSANTIPFDSLDQIGLITDSYTKFHEEYGNSGFKTWKRLLDG